MATTTLPADQRQNAQSINSALEQRLAQLDVLESNLVSTEKFTKLHDSAEKVQLELSQLPTDEEMAAHYDQLLADTIADARKTFIPARTNALIQQAGDAEEARVAQELREIELENAREQVAKQILASREVQQDIAHRADEMSDHDLTNAIESLRGQDAAYLIDTSKELEQQKRDVITQWKDWEIRESLKGQDVRLSPETVESIEAQAASARTSIDPGKLNEQALAEFENRSNEIRDAEHETARQAWVKKQFPDEAIRSGVEDRVREMLQSAAAVREIPGLSNVPGVKDVSQVPSSAIMDPGTLAEQRREATEYMAHIAPLTEKRKAAQDFVTRARDAVETAGAEPTAEQEDSNKAAMTRANSSVRDYRKEVDNRGREVLKAVQIDGAVAAPNRGAAAMQLMGQALGQAGSLIGQAAWDQVKKAGEGIKGAALSTKKAVWNRRVGTGLAIGAAGGAVIAASVVAAATVGVATAAVAAAASIAGAALAVAAPGVIAAIQRKRAERAAKSEAEELPYLQAQMGRATESMAKHKPNWRSRALHILGNTLGWLAKRADAWAVGRERKQRERNRAAETRSEDLRAKRNEAREKLEVTEAELGRSITSSEREKLEAQKEDLQQKLLSPQLAEMRPPEEDAPLQQDLKEIEARLALNHISDDDRLALETVAKEQRTQYEKLNRSANISRRALRGQERMGGAPEGAGAKLAVTAGWIDTLADQIHSKADSVQQKAKTKRSNKKAKPAGTDDDLVATPPSTRVVEPLTPPARSRGM